MMMVRMEDGTFLNKNGKVMLRRGAFMRFGLWIWSHGF